MNEKPASPENLSELDRMRQFYEFQIGEMNRRHDEAYSRVADSQRTMESRVAWICGAPLVGGLLLMLLTVYTTTRSVSKEVAEQYTKEISVQYAREAAREAADNLEWSKLISSALPPDRIAKEISPESLRLAVLKLSESQEFVQEVAKRVVTPELSEKAAKELLVNDDFKDLMKSRVQGELALRIADTESFREMMRKEFDANPQDINKLEDSLLIVEGSNDLEITASLLAAVKNVDNATQRKRYIWHVFYPFDDPIGFTALYRFDGENYTVSGFTVSGIRSSKYADKLDSLLEIKATDNQGAFPMDEDGISKLKPNSYQSKPITKDMADKFCIDRLIQIASLLSDGKLPTKWRLDLDH